MTNHLKGLSEKTVRKLQQIGRDWLLPIDFSVSIKDITEIRQEEEYYFFTSRVTYPYAHQTATGLKLSKNKKHYITGNYLIDDIVSGKRIVINSYH